MKRGGRKRGCVRGSRTCSQNRRQAGGQTRRRKKAVQTVPEERVGKLAWKLLSRHTHLLIRLFELLLSVLHQLHHLVEARPRLLELLAVVKPGRSSRRRSRRGGGRGRRGGRCSFALAALAVPVPVAISAPVRLLLGAGCVPVLPEVLVPHLARDAELERCGAVAHAEDVRRLEGLDERPVW